MSEQLRSPKLMVRVRAALTGEVSAGTVETYQHAGGAVLDLYVGVEQRREELIKGHADLWQLDSATHAQFLCCWDAFALQTLGDAFLQADYAVDPKTVGFLPPVTEKQVLAFYSEVEPWVSRAHQAQSNPKYEFDVMVPALLPPWADVDPCPHAHLDAMLAACATMRERAELAVSDAARAAGDGHAEELAQFRQALAAVTSAADHAASLDHHHAPPELHERIEQAIKGAIEGAYRLGQLAAMPRLISDPESVAGGRVPLPGPGQSRFDPWCLTDPQSRSNWQKDRDANRAVTLLWQRDPDPHRTLSIQSELSAALAAGRIQYATDHAGRRLGNYYCCPWAPIYSVMSTTTIAGTRVGSGQQFTFDVSAEEMSRGGHFKRELLVGDFSPTDHIDYCDE